jgi:hypothetical protein
MLDSPCSTQRAVAAGGLLRPRTDDLASGRGGGATRLDGRRSREPLHFYGRKATAGAGGGAAALRRGERSMPSCEQSRREGLDSGDHLLRGLLAVGHVGNGPRGPLGARNRKLSSMSSHILDQYNMKLDDTPRVSAETVNFGHMVLHN